MMYVSSLGPCSLPQPAVGTAFAASSAVPPRSSGAQSDRGRKPEFEMAPSTVDRVAAVSRTMVLPRRPQRLGSGANTRGCSLTRIACCSRVSLITASDLAGPPRAANIVRLTLNSERPRRKTSSTLGINRAMCRKSSGLITARALSRMHQLRYPLDDSHRTARRPAVGNRVSCGPSGRGWPILMTSSRA